MTSPAASSSPGTPGLDIPRVSVVPGGTASTSLTVRNDGDIVEAYHLEVVGDCAAWATVEPERISLYPGTSETVTITLAPPRSSQVRAGDVPLAVRVLPTEHPEGVRVPETLVHVEEFRELRTAVTPRRRRGWLRGRYRFAVRNEGNAPVQVAFTAGQAGEELKFAFTPATRALEPGESAEIGLRVRAGRPVWFGTPTTWPFTVEVSEPRDAEDSAQDPTAVRTPLDVEFVQIPIFPRWLLALLAALLALIIAWFLLVRPAVRSTAKEAADELVQKRPAPSAPPSVAPPGSTDPTKPGGSGGAGSGGGKGSGGGSGSGSGGTGDGAQSSATIDLETSGGKTETGLYTVPKDKAFEITDIVVANFQGDEGVITINFGDRKVTTIALETFRNQDYHWVTPIRIVENQTVTIQVTCAKPGTPATGRQAQKCHEVLNVSGVLSDLR
ncbi:hydrolytic protein [Streptomyces sp. NPDC090025]|uniref:COG1470 family protein n=1 Tax=Streptomyces sp. NPDC090025 TaxID=3365922 RepID=UPI00383808C1